MNLSKDPLGIYKFTSLNVSLDSSIKAFTRETYDVLSWLGDCGGLRDGIIWIGSVIISAFSSYSAKNLLLTTLFRVIPSS